jgi:RNA polymerase-binding protein DksA
MPERQDFIKILMEKREECERTLKRLYEIKREYMEKMDESSTNDESDLAQREISLANVYSMIERKNHEIREIDLLIQRLEKDQDFGICEECGAEIPVERLLLMPGTTLCVDCQAEYERLGKIQKLKTEGMWTKDYEELEWMEEAEEDLGLRETTISVDVGQGEGAS